MNKSILTLSLILSIFTNSLFSTPVINRTRIQCIPGCNTVTRVETDNSTYDDEGNLVDEDITIDINCSGWGLLHCPNSLVAPGEESKIDPFTNSNGQLLFDYALNQISLGTLNGTYFMNFLNTSNGQLWKFTATWTTVSGVETISVTKYLIP